jgi:hypothetical protein
MRISRRSLDTIYVIHIHSLQITGSFKWFLVLVESIFSLQIMGSIVLPREVGTIVLQRVELEEKAG